MEKVIGFTDLQLQKRRDDSLALYNKFGYVACPALENRKVCFTAEGFNHLIYKPKKGREKSDEYFRLNLVQYIKHIIGLTTTIQETDEVIQMVDIKDHGKRAKADRLVKYWGFIAIINRTRIKITVRQIGEGQLHFWSVQPYWKMTNHNNIHVRNLATGNLAED